MKNGLLPHQIKAMDAEAFQRQTKLLEQFVDAAGQAGDVVRELAELYGDSPTSILPTDTAPLISVEDIRRLVADTQRVTALLNVAPLQEQVRFR